MDIAGLERSLQELVSEVAGSEMAALVNRDGICLGVAGAGRDSARQEEVATMLAAIYAFANRISDVTHGSLDTVRLDLDERLAWLLPMGDLVVAMIVNRSQNPNLENAYRRLEAWTRAWAGRHIR